MSSNKRGSTYSVVHRLLRTLQHIPRQREGAAPRIGTSDLLKRLEEEGFDISLRTLQRDLRELQAIFPDLRNDGNRDALGWFWAADAEQVNIPSMDTVQALALKLANHFLQPVMPGLIAPLEKYLTAAERILGAEQTAVLERIRFVPRSMPLQAAAIPPAVVEIVLTALAEKRRIRVRYASRSGGAPGEYVLSPLGVVLRNEVAYLLATAWEYQDVRHYALHRFDPRHVELLDEPVTEPDGFDLDRTLNEGAFQYRLGEEPLTLVLRMREETAAHLRETPLADDQQMESAEGCDGSWIRIRATVADTLQLRWWLLGLGANVEVEAPESLRREIVGQLGEALGLYERGQSTAS